MRINVNIDEARATLASLDKANDPATAHVRARIATAMQAARDNPMLSAEELDVTLSSVNHFLQQYVTVREQRQLSQVEQRRTQLLRGAFVKLESMRDKAREREQAGG